VEELNQKISDLNSKIEKDLTDNSEQGQQVIELWGKLEHLKKEENNQIVSLQRQLNSAQVETNQLTEGNKKTNAQVVQTEQRKLFEAEKKLTAQILTNKVQEQAIEGLKERERKLEKEIKKKRRRVKENWKRLPIWARPRLRTFCSWRRVEK